MYIPKQNIETDLPTLQNLIRLHPLGAWVTLGEGELVANHIPFYLDASRGEFGTLVAHIARANPVWQSFSKTIPSVVIFQGAESYITPSWYPSKKLHGKMVPTWNYVVVHARGFPTIHEDRDWLLGALNRITDHQEQKRAAPWKVADAPEDYLDRLLAGIVGLEIPITSLTGKWKVSQEKAEPDQLGVIAGLAELGDAEAVRMAALVRERMQTEKE